MARRRAYSEDEDLLIDPLDQPAEQSERQDQGMDDSPAQKAKNTLAWLWEKLTKVNRKTWIIRGVSFVVAVGYLSQMLAPEQARTFKDKNDRRSLPAFDEARLVKANQAEIANHERQVSAFLDEERQRATIEMARAYRSIAALYMATPGHPCNGRAEVECLDTFFSNRIDTLNRLSEGVKVEGEKGVSPQAVFFPILKNAAERERVVALRLARILAKPGENRDLWEQEWVDNSYPVLTSGIPLEELKTRPATAAQLLQQSAQLKQKMFEGSREATIRRDRCQSLPPEKQPPGGC